MRLVDSSVWIDHIRKPDTELVQLLNAGQVKNHPFVTGEILLGSLRNRRLVATQLDGLPNAVMASTQDVRIMIERTELFGRGIGWVDAHLLASCRLTEGLQLWTRDKRLRQAAQALGLA